MAQTVYRVSQVNSYIKNLFENDYALRRISVGGEVSNCKYHTSGHIYFTLKDETGTLSCVMFAGNRLKGLHFQMQDGMQVVASGRVMIYERDGKYQLYATEILQDGTGDLYARYEETKKRLEEMGMFAPQYKKPIPRFASRIGIVTAETGAAIQDIINISTRRNPYVQLYLYPAIVQGEAAAPSVVRGISKLDRMGLDVIIVGRGGGSIEDLWAFNEEIVARAIFDADTPIISAVGHETDTTIADLVADLRAPTPSAAAELAVYEISAFEDELKNSVSRMIRILDGELARKKLELTKSEHRLEKCSPRYKLDEKRQNLVNIQEALRECIHDAYDTAKQQLALYSAKLSAESPLAIMSSGYAFTEKNGKPVSSAKNLQTGDELSVYFKDGKATTKVTDLTCSD